MTSPSPPNPNDARPGLTRMHWILISIVITGAIVIAGIGFSGSYSAVRELAEKRGFGAFAAFFPIGIDAGILVCLALDLLLTWIRIPFPLLRQTAWLLTAATIAFNGAAAWPDPLGVGMHAVIPVLFIVAVEAARHAIGRIADITADKHMDGVRFSRWLLSPVPTYRLWRRMKLWELRSYELAVALEQDRMVYQARLRARYGRSWRRKAPVDAMTPLRLAKYGVPLAQTGAAGLEAAGITTPLVFFADNLLPTPDKPVLDADNTTPDADKLRTTIERLDSASAPADNSEDKMSAPKELEADNKPSRPELSASSAQMSAPADEHPKFVREDNGGHPHQDMNPQVDIPFADELVRPGIPLRPLDREHFATLSATDNPAADTVSDGHADIRTADSANADNGADNHADKLADNGAEDGTDADNGADNYDADNVDEDKKPPRGAIANGVRAQLAIGVNDTDVITDRLSQALGHTVDKKTVARIMRREQTNAAITEPKPEPGIGPYL